MGNEPVTRDITDEDYEQIAGALDWFDHVLQEKFEMDVGLVGQRDDIPTLEFLLGKLPVSDDMNADLMTFGTAFGEVLADEMELDWVVYKDEFGSTYALKHQDHAVYLFPLDMFYKRFDRGEDLSGINLSWMIDELKKVVAGEVKKFQG